MVGFDAIAVEKRWLSLGMVMSCRFCLQMVEAAPRWEQGEWSVLLAMIESLHLAKLGRLTQKEGRTLGFACNVREKNYY